MNDMKKYRVVTTSHNGTQIREYNSLEEATAAYTIAAGTCHRVNSNATATLYEVIAEEVVKYEGYFGH